MFFKKKSNLSKIIEKILSEINDKSLTKKVRKLISDYASGLNHIGNMKKGKFKNNIRNMWRKKYKNIVEDLNCPDILKSHLNTHISTYYKNSYREDYQKTYFISGHRDITEEEFRKYYHRKILKRVKQGHCFVIGDYHGADTMAQDLLKKINYPTHKVMIYHMGPAPMYNAGFPMRSGFKDDIERDSAMTRDSDDDIAWVRKGTVNSGTQQNIDRRNNALL